MLPMNNYQTNANPNPIHHFYYIKNIQIWTFLTFVHFPILQSLPIIALIMTNTMTCAMKREAWTWYLPSHLVVAKILCSCTMY